MTNEQRIEKIEQFVHLQRYVHGLRFHVIEDPDQKDGFIIEFAEASQRQLHAINNRLKINGMTHIRSRAQIVKEFENQPKKKKR